MLVNICAQRFALCLIGQTWPIDAVCFTLTGQRFDFAAQNYEKYLIYANKSANFARTCVNLWEERRANPPMSEPIKRRKTKKIPRGLAYVKNKLYLCGRKEPRMDSRNNIPGEWT